MDASSLSPLPAPTTAPATGGTSTTADATTGGTHGHSFLWSGDDFSFGDVLDVINPLQHIPVVSTIYRAITGDRIGHLPQLLGDTLYGGAMGAASAVANIATEEITGKDIGQQVMSVLGFDDNSSSQLASAGGGTAPARPLQIVALSRGPMDPEDRRSDVNGGYDNGKIWGVAPVVNPTLASTGSATAAGAAPISGSGLAAPVGGPLAASMATADAAVAAGLSGLDAGPVNAGTPNLAGVSPQIPGGGSSAGAPGTLASLNPGLSSGSYNGPSTSPTSGMRPLISSSQGGMVRSLSGQTLSNHAVPLSLPNGLTGGFRRSTTPQNATQPSWLDTVTANNTGVTVSNSATGTSGVPLDVSQRMIDALDRYNQLEAARKAAQANTVNGVH